MAYESVKRDVALQAPVVGKRAHLRRHRLIGTLVRARNNGCRLFLIEGQAGQGKSTLAAQYIDEMSLDSVWYAINANDRDPAWFVPNLLGHLNAHLEGFSCPLLDDMVSKGEIVSVDCYSYGVMVAQALYHHPVTLVFDDLHLLESSPSSLSFLTGFCRTRVPGRTQLLLSRHPIKEILFSGTLPHGATHITGASLAMSRSEVAECLSSLFHLTPSRETVGHIHTITEGWTMGVLARAHTLHIAGEEAALSPVPEDNVSAYLTREILENCFPAESLSLLSDLAWCRTIPMDLAREVSGTPDIHHLFEQLEERNLFTRFADASHTVALFHHHLQHCLREYSLSIRSKREQSDLFSTIATWYEKHGKPEDAARFFLDAGNHDEVERIIRDRGLALCSAGRLETLRRSIGRIPEEAITQRGWLACNYGIALMEVDPASALSYLQAAERCFLSNGDSLGLLVSRVQRLYFHTWVDAFFHKGRPYLGPVHNALNELEESLDDQIKLKTLYCLACGYAFFDANLTLASLCADKALRIALKKEFHNAACEIRIIRCYIHGFKGDWRRFNIEMEPLVPLLSSPRVSSYNRVIGWVTLLNILAMQGDFGNYRHYRDLTSTFIDNETLLLGVARPFIHIWDMDIALAEGKVDQAESLVHDALALPQVHNPHIGSQCLHYQAFILAMQKEHQKVPAICHESLAQRLTAGSPYFIGLTRMVTGGALALCGAYEEAETQLLEALELFEGMEEAFELSATLAHLSHLYWVTGRLSMAKRRTSQWLRLMKKQRYTYHFTWTPHMCGALLDRAVIEGIETETAQALAAVRLGRGYTLEGDPIPLLTIQAFGGFVISVEGRELLTARDLTPSQQRLFALLITRRNRVLSIDEIQTLFWPDASPQKGRANLDTLVSRLKKTLKKSLAPYDPATYLSIKKEKLTLSNTRVDIWDFIEKAEEGLKEFRSKAFWQAGNRFRSAFTMAIGPCLTDLSDDGPGHEFKEYTLAPLALRAATAWARVTQSLGLPGADDFSAMERQITGDPESMELVRALHDLYTATRRPHRADQLLKRYRNKLMTEGMAPSEIEAFLENFWV